jgi:hypothetical protein
MTGHDQREDYADPPVRHEPIGWGLERLLGLRIDLSQFYQFAMHHRKLGSLAQRFRGASAAFRPVAYNSTKVRSSGVKASSDFMVSADHSGTSSGGSGLTMLLFVTLPLCFPFDFPFNSVPTAVFS